ncbi:portal protein [Mycolicibacterium peregrinum]|uniref:portal protein n=1 Tax=Mycolicibacterium peregrinum TaxID=43304 RepID=UPI003AAE8C16
MTSPVGAYGAIGTVSGLDDTETATLNELWSVWTAKMRRNLLRAQYYDQKNLLEDLGIGVPPHMTNLNAVLGWPAKSVDVLARRCKFEQFTLPGVDDDPLGIGELWTDNDMDVELPQSIASAFLHSCTFMMVTKGDTTAGEPSVLISSQSALYGAGLWDSRLRRLRAAFSITNTDLQGRVIEFVLFLPKVTIRARWDRKWDIQRFPHTLDRLPVEVLPCNPRLDRPFGKSRITRAVMGLADSAFRTMVRLEGHAEFFSGPQRYAMGADEEMFQDEAGNPLSQWQAVMGRIWAAPRDEDGNMPQMGQFPATSPQPHIEQIRALASLFCGETDLPLSALGIVHDNPASAEAIEAAERDLIIEAKYAMGSCFGPRLVRIAKTAVEIRDGSLPSIASGLAARWSAPENPLLSAAADGISKVVAALPYLAESTIPLEKMDWDEATIRRAMADKRKAGVSNIMARLTNGGVPNGTAVPTQPGSEPGDGGPANPVVAG